MIGIRKFDNRRPAPIIAESPTTKTKGGRRMYPGFWDGVKTIVQQGAQVRLTQVTTTEEKRAVESTINQFLAMPEPKDLNESLQRLTGAIAVQGILNNLDM